MTERFDARSLQSGLDEENDPFFVVAVRGAEGRYLMMLRGARENDDGRIYVELDDQSGGGYDCVNLCELSADGMTLRLARPLKVGSGSVERVVVSFPHGVRPSVEFVAHVRATFAGQEGRLSVAGDAAPA